MKVSLSFLFLASLAICPLFSQTVRTPNPGSVTTPGGGNLPGTSTGNSGANNAPSRTQQQPTFGQDPSTNMPIFISGKVAMADGSPVPQGISIKRVCMSDTRTVAYTDSKGHFSFQLGQQSAILPDASEPGFDPSRRGQSGGGGSFGGPGNTIGSQSNLGCELHADAPGFTSEPISLDSRHALDNPEVGTIVLHRLANVEGTSISATSFNAPSDAKKAYEKGLQSMHKGKPADAQKDFEKAVGIYPKYANAWLDLGRARMKQQSVEQAVEAFQKALEADGKLVEAQVELGIYSVRQKNWADAAKFLDSALRLDPIDFPQLWFPDAVANFNLQNYDNAEKSVREALKLDKQHKNPQADQLLGFILANKKDYSGAVAELQTYIKLAPDAADLDQIKTQLANIQSLQLNSTQ